MITIKSQREIDLMREAGRIVGLIHQELAKVIKPGVTTNQLDKIVYDITIAHDAKPSFKGYGGFPGSICASVNEVLVHGIPNDVPLKDGDIISVDVGVCYKGYHGDSAWTYTVGTVDEEKLQLLEVTKKSLLDSLDIIKPGIHLSDISHMIQSIVEPYGYGIPIEYTGHGIGSQLHEDPHIPNYGLPNKGPILKEGMCLAIEPMVNMGSRHVKTLNDGWTVVTNDKKVTAHYEHTIVVTASGYEILTTL